MRGLSDDVYCQIGLVMLIGLAAKNAILIVEFAEQLRKQGRSIADAAMEAAELRLRPILMTSFAFILGILPLAFASGAGQAGRHSIGTTIIGGMLVSTVLNLFFIPVLYVLTKTILEKFGGGPEPRTGSWSSNHQAMMVDRCQRRVAVRVLTRRRFLQASGRENPVTAANTLAADSWGLSTPVKHSTSGESGTS